MVGSFYHGGSEAQAVQLIRLLRQSGDYEVLVATLNRAGPLLEEVKEPGSEKVPEFRLSTFHDANFVKQVRSCVRFMKDNNISIIHTHDFYTNVFGMVAGFVARVPLRIASKRETGIRSRPQLFVERRAFNLTHQIVVNADTVKRYLIDSGVPRRKITTIHNGLDPRRVEPTGKERQIVLKEFGLPDVKGSRFVTILANLRSPVKNHAMFLRAAQIVQKKVSGIYFIIAGEGNLIPETKKLATELGLADRTFFIGRCKHVADLLSITEVGVLCSVSEGFPNSILEYMAASVPVVATSVGGIAEAVVDQETGFLVETNRYEAMADRIIRILDDEPEAARFAARGRERIDKYFSLENQLNSTLKLYGA